MKGAHTPEKQTDLEAIFIVLINAGNKIIDLYERKGWLVDPSFWVFDLNAGPGVHDDGSIGSPLILLDILKRYTKRNCQLILFENDHDKKGNYINLCNNIDKMQIPKRIKITTINGCHIERLPEFYANTKEKRFGLCYQDYSGVPNFEILRDFSHISCYSKTDILINCNTTQIARNRGLEKSKKKNYTLTKETRPPEEAIKDIDKSNWQIRHPLGQWKWQMLLGTNWDAAPNFKKYGFEKHTSKD